MQHLFPLPAIAGPHLMRLTRIPASPDGLPSTNHLLDPLQPSHLPLLFWPDRSQLLHVGRRHRRTAAAAGRRRRERELIDAASARRQPCGVLGRPQGLRHESEADGAVRRRVQRDGNLLVDALVNQPLGRCAEEGAELAAALGRDGQPRARA